MVPIQVTEEIHRQLKKKGDPFLNELAAAADSVLQRYLKDNLLDIGSDEDETRSGRTFADQIFVRLAIRYGPSKSLCFITQDRALAVTLIANVPHDPIALGQQVKVTYISDRSGRLHDWPRRLAREERGGKNSVTSSVESGGNSSAKESARSRGRRRDEAGSTARPEPRSRQNSAMESVSPFEVADQVVSTPATRLACTRFPVEGDEIISGSGARYVLRKEISEGGEGKIYFTSDDAQVCKIYHPECLTQFRKSKIELMLSRAVKIPGVCWPTDIVKTLDGEFVGYLMPKAGGKLLKTSVFGKPLIERNFSGWTRVNLTRLAITILKTIDGLHSLNVLIGDINPQNILVVDEHRIFIVDTDSFQIEGYPCPVGTETYTPPGRQGLNFSEFLRTKDDELFAVTTLLFMILFPGKPPYSAQGGGDPAENIKNRIFPYGSASPSEKNIKPVGSWQFIWSHLHPSLKEDFQAVFQHDRRVPIVDLIKHLRISIRDIEAGNRSSELFPKQPRLLGKTVSAVCDICGKTDQISEFHAKNLQEKKQSFRHNDCVTVKRIQRLETTREIECAICGKMATSTVDHLDRIQSKGQDYWCRDCAKQRSAARGWSRSSGASMGNSSGAGRFVGTIILVVFLAFLVSRCS